MELNIFNTKIIVRIFLTLFYSSGCVLAYEASDLNKFKNTKTCVFAET